MKRIQDKIKDLVEPQVFEQIGSFTGDPAQALSAYRFTDVTSDLLARWLDAVALSSRGEALALAGARGVGKSHALAVFGALVGSERLRASVEDSHVATSAGRLAGRRYAVVHVERGTRPTLGGEFAAALSEVFGGREAEWGLDPSAMLTVAASRSPDEKLVVIVDTAFNRPARVVRDDGRALGDLAVTARSVGAFVALALDDDIEGADGANVSLAATCRIDYLDPENLYRVADQFVLRKRPQGRDTINDIYVSLRASVPNFNWSAARFASLYPVHPLVAEVAAGIRLYDPKFAFLPFAAGVAVRAAARPAFSLVLLDEVFDAAEARLRRSPELKDAFAAYDQLAARCVGQLPVMQRHHARLILKSLFVLSLDGRGATAGELCGALLLNDELMADASRQVDEILARFAEAAGTEGMSLDDDGGEGSRCRFRIASQEAFEHEGGAPRASSEGMTTSVASTEDVAAGGERRSKGAGASGDSREEVATVEVGKESQRGGGAPSSGVAAPPVVSTASESFAELRAELLAAESLAEEPSAPEAGFALKGSAVAARPAEVEEEGEGAQAEGSGLAEDLSAWARLLAEHAELPNADGDASDTEVVRAWLSGWLSVWRGLSLREKFDALPDVRLTTLVWKYEAEASKSFGLVARAVEAALGGRVSLEECLRSVVAAFRGSRDVFAERARKLEGLIALVENFERRERLRSYLARAEATGLDDIEAARRELLALADDTNSLLDERRRERFEVLWREFHLRYTEHYASAHDKAMKDDARRAEIWAIMRGARWREFESLARLPLMSGQIWRQVEELLRQSEGARCDFPVRRLLAEQPTCVCRFRLTRARALERLPFELEASMERGLEIYRRTLSLLASHLAIALDEQARAEEDEGEALRARTLSKAFAQGCLPESFTCSDVRAIERALQTNSSMPPVKVHAPESEAGLLTRDELSARLNQWLDELPEHPVLIEVVRGNEAGVAQDGR